VYAHSLQNKCPSWQATGSRARCKHKAQASNLRMDSWPSRCCRDGDCDCQGKKIKGDSVDVPLLSRSRVSCAQHTKISRMLYCSCCASSLDLMWESYRRRLDTAQISQIDGDHGPATYINIISTFYRRFMIGQPSPSRCEQTPKICRSFPFIP